jgi:anaphase-promoting complex subunit 10
MRLSSLAIAVDHRLDESYTPHRVSVRAGTHARDLKEIAAATLDEPAGWVVVPLQPPDGR